MLCCWRFLHRHIIMKMSRIRTMTPKMQPTIRYKMPPVEEVELGGYMAGGVKGC